MSREPSEKERFEVLLEQVRHELEMVAEGHVSLDQKMDRLTGEFSSKYESLDQKVEWLAKKTDDLSQKMDKGFVEVRKDLHALANQLQDHIHTHS